MTISYKNKTLGSYYFSIILLASILLGGLTGYIFGKDAQRLKPLGDIFLDLILTGITPLIFFSVSSAIAKAGSLKKIGKILLYMSIIFVFTGVIAAIYSLIVLELFPPAKGVYLPLVDTPPIPGVSFSKQLAGIFTVSDFSKLLSHNNILPLMIFSILVGLAVASAKKGKKLVGFLQAGENIFMRVFSLIMYYAPIGFFAYFASLVGELGSTLMESYIKITAIYYAAGLLYFLVAFTGYAYFAGKMEGVSLFWKHVFLPMTTSIATCSSAASIPANLVATEKMQVPSEIYETVVPLGAMIHKSGSVMGGVFKIAFLFGIFHMPFAGVSVLLTALGVSLLVGMVMGAIPSGGMLGELLILNIYGFPSSVLIAIAAISIIIDPLATMLNVTGNTVSAMMIARLVEGKEWFSAKRPT